MRIFLTGASGYLGAHLERELLGAALEVTAVVRTAGAMRDCDGAAGLQVVEADLDGPARLDGALGEHDVLIHAALIWGAPGSEFEMRDSAAAARLFETAGRAGVRRCIYVSSTAVHRPFAGEMGEDDALRPPEIYAQTKAAGEDALRDACATHGMRGVVLRPGPMVGPPAFPGGRLRTPRFLEEMVRAAAQGEPLQISGTDARQLVDVSEVARALRMLATVEEPAATYLCVDREPTGFEAMARTVVECLQSSSDVHLTDSGAAEPPPRFRTTRIEALLGGPLESSRALQAHLRQLARQESPTPPGR